MNRIQQARRVLLICLLLAGATLALYWPARLFDYVDYDDNILVTDNAVVKSGLNWTSVRWALTKPVIGIWHPVTTLSHMLDCQLFGVHAEPQHLVNVLLHSANAVLLFLASRRLTGTTWRSACAAAIFALHPLRVESVAWISERKDVLSGFFFMLTLWAWTKRLTRLTMVAHTSESAVSQVSNLRMQEASERVTPTEVRPTGSRRYGRLGGRRYGVWYVLALVFFVLGLMSKPMLVTLPFVLLLLDFWPLGRVRSAGLMRLCWEKWPFFAVTALFSYLTFYFQRTGTAVVSLERVSMGDRLGNAVVSYLRYLGKFFWPTDLAAIYPHPSNPFPLIDRWAPWQVWLGALALIGITGFCCRILLRCARSDSGVSNLAEEHDVVTSVANDKGGQGSETLPEPAGEDARATRPIRTAQACATAYDDVHENPSSEGCTTAYLPVGWFWFLGTMVPVIGLVQVGAQAMADRYTYIPLIGVAIAVVWGVADVLNTKSEIRNPKVEKQGFEEVGATPNSAGLVVSVPRPSYMGFSLAIGALIACCAITHQQLGYWRNTISLFEHTIAVTADNPDAHFGLGTGLQKTGQPKQAMTEYRVALAINPSLAEAHYDLGQLLRQMGQLDASAREYEAVFKTYPGHYEAHFNLAGVYWLLDRRAEAIAQMEAAMRSDPSSAAALNNLAWWLAAGSDPKFRNGSRAVELAQRACELTEYKQPLMIGTLAAAYAEAGRFSEAADTAERAGQLAERLGEPAIAAKNKQLSELYRAGKAFHEAAGN